MAQRHFVCSPHRLLLAVDALQQLPSLTAFMSQAAEGCAVRRTGVPRFTDLMVSLFRRGYHFW